MHGPVEEGREALFGRRHEGRISTPEEEEEPLFEAHYLSGAGELTPTLKLRPQLWARIPVLAPILGSASQVYSQISKLSPHTNHYQKNNSSFLKSQRILGYENTMMQLFSMLGPHVLLNL